MDVGVPDAAIPTIRSKERLNGLLVPPEVVTEIGPKEATGGTVRWINPFTRPPPEVTSGPVETPVSGTDSSPNQMVTSPSTKPEPVRLSDPS